MLFQSSCRYAVEEIRGENAISKETMTVAPECILNSSSLDSLSLPEPTILLAISDTLDELVAIAYK